MDGRTNHVFCDVDGTLLIWPTLPGSPRPGETPRVNTALVEALRAWQARTGGQLVIWSGGGAKHAEMARELCGLFAICLAKPEVMIDDAEPALLMKKLRAIKPEKFKG
jgi:hypothetical protein